MAQIFAVTRSVMIQLPRSRLTGKSVLVLCDGDRFCLAQ